MTSVVTGHDGRYYMYLTPTDEVAILDEAGTKVVEKHHINWHPITNIPEGKLLNGGLINDLTHVMYDPVLDRYLATVRTWAPLAGSKVPGKWRRSVAFYTSRDGIEFENTGRLLQADLPMDRYVENLAHRKRHDLPAWGELHDMPVQRYENLLIALQGILFFYDEDPAKQREITGTETSYFLGWSRDGLNWSRTMPEKRDVLIDMPHGSDSWGRHTAGSPFMVVTDRELWLYTDVGRGHTNAHYKTPRPKQITIAKLRRDGFAGYRAAETGWIETAPFVAGGDLKLNIDASAGEARVAVYEVVEDREHYGKRTLQPIEGFSFDACEAMTDDLHVATPRWSGGAWGDLEGRLVSLRIELTDATLYSFWTRSGDGADVIVNFYNQP